MSARRVALDATPLLGHPTGVGVFCRGALGGLARREDLEVSAFAVSWRRRAGIAGLVPPGVTVRQRAMPARPLHWSWSRVDHPVIEHFIGVTDVVHGTNFVVPPAGGAAQVVTVHDLTPLRFPELCDAATLAYPALIRRALERGAFVHTPSSFVAAEVADAFGVPSQRVRPVHSGVPPLQRGGADATGTPALQGVLPRGTDRYVLAVGTAEPRKDLPGLVAAFDEVAKDHPGAALVLAGPPGWGEEDLRTAIAAAQFAERIVRTGWVDDETLGALLTSAALLAFPSVYEGFGFPPLQAMVAGVPVVATNAGALPEVLGDAALLVEVGDRDALAGALAAVLGSAELRADLIARGAKRTRAFSWDGCAAGLANLYADATAEARPSPVLRRIRPKRGR